MSDVATSKVLSVRRVARLPTVVDITVANTHNFYVRAHTQDKSVLVHNCAMDAQICVALYHAQLERATRTRITKNHCYDKWFRTHVANQMSNTVHALSHMHQVGSQLDTEYLDFLLSKQSPLIKVKKEVEALLRKSPAVQKLNATLLKAVGASSGGLFAGTAADTGSNVFQINKPDHKTALFFDILGLKPVAFTDTGKPSVGKALFNAYRLLYPEVDLMEQWQKASKLLGTYVVGWKTRLTENLDSIKDMCLRPSFGFFGVVTGRLNSFKPSLQQIPQHGANAKYVKRAFVAPLNMLSVKWDFSAAEVRKAACVSFDDNLAEAFRVGQKLRQQYIQTPTEALAKELKTKGDVHIANVFRFFGKWVDRRHALRQAIKAVVFGVIYGKSVRTLARDLENDAEATHKKAILAIEAEIRNLEQALKAA